MRYMTEDGSIFATEKDALAYELKQEQLKKEQEEFQKQKEADFNKLLSALENYYTLLQAYNKKYQTIETNLTWSDLITILFE